MSLSLSLAPRLRGIFLLAVLVAGGGSGVEGGASKLKIATCNPTYPPFVMKDYAGSFTGLEVVLLKGAYKVMMQQVAEINATDILDLIGDGIPPITGIRGFPSDAIQPLVNGTIDIYFCGAYMTPDRSDFVDFSPPTIASDFTMIVSAQPATATLQQVQLKAFGKPNALAIYTVVILLFLNLLFAHLVWVCERRYNGSIRTVYGPGVYDSFWMGIITATTIGFGDKTPKTYFGRIVTIVWMVVGVYFTGLFAAAITSGFITQSLADSSGQATLKMASDLSTSNRRVGAAFPKAGDALRIEAPGISIANFDAPLDAYRALARGQIDVLVDDRVMATWNVANIPEFKYAFTLQGQSFGQVDYGFLIGMPGGKSHPIYTHFYRALLEYLKGASRLQTDAIVQTWFGNAYVVVPATFAQVLQSMLADINVQMGWVLFAWILTWIVIVLATQKKRTPLNVMHMAFLKALKLEDFEFNRHIVRRAAEDLFQKIDTDHNEIVDLKELQYALKALSGYESPEFPRLVLREMKRVIGDHAVDAPIQRRKRGIGSRKKKEVNSLISVVDMGSEAMKMALRMGSPGVVLQKTMSFARTGTFDEENGPASQVAGGGGLTARGTFDSGAEHNWDASSVQVSLSKEEFVQIITHIILECGTNPDDVDDHSPATQHHLLHVHDEIRRQLDILDYKAQMVERRLREQQGEDSEHEEPESPQGMPGSPLKSAEMKPSYEERRAKMEQRWKQTLGVDHLPASPIEMGVGMVFPQRFRMSEAARLAGMTGGDIVSVERADPRVDTAYARAQLAQQNLLGRQSSTGSQGMTRADSKAGQMC